MKHIFHDGGRTDAGFTGHVGDCVVRAISIATGRPYKQVYEELRLLLKAIGEPSPRHGVDKQVAKKYMASLGWKWTSGNVKFREDELPSGVLVLLVSEHWCCVKDGIVYDTHDPTRGGNRCVYGWYRPPAGGENTAKEINITEFIEKEVQRKTTFSIKRILRKEVIHQCNKLKIKYDIDKYRGKEMLSYEAPKGKTLCSPQGCHFVDDYPINTVEDLKAVLDDLNEGLEDCSEPDCDWCKG